MNQRLLTEAEVDRLKATGQVAAGQCHAVDDDEGRLGNFCHNKRSCFRRTCDDHRGVLPFRDPNEERLMKPA